MPSNTTLNSGTGGDVIATKERTHDGDATKVQVVTLAGVTGTEGAYTFGDIAHGGGVEAAALRVTLASDSTGVVSVDDNGGSITVDGTVAVTNGGTFATQVDGAALTALQLIDNASYADGDSWARTTGGLRAIGCAVETAAPTLTNGDVAAPSLTTSGALRVAVASGGVAGVTEDAASAGGEEGVLILGVRRDTAASSSGTDGDFSTFNLDSTGRLHVNVGNTVTVGSHAVTNAGTFAVQVDGSALTALQLIDNPIIVDDAAFTPATSSVTMAGFQADETATDSVDEGDAGAARTTLDREQIVTLQGHTAGGLSIFRSLDIDESEEEIKASAGVLYFIHAMNMVATARYLKFYNATAANVAVGTTTPVLTFPIPANSTTGAGFTVSIPQGLTFSTAISVACTTGVADADTGAPGANDVIINIGYM